MAIVDDDEDMTRKDSSHKWWWIDSSHSAAPRSPWLRSTLSELDRKTKAMMKLIETEADSFAQRAEMYYKKRPELINMVQDFYKGQRSLLEQFDQLQSENRTRLPRRSLSPTKSSVSIDYYERGGKRSTTMSLSSDHHEPFDCKSTISSGMGDGDQDQNYRCCKPGLFHDRVVEDSYSAAESEVDDCVIEDYAGDHDQNYDCCKPSICRSHSELVHDGVVEDSYSAAESEVDDAVVEDDATSAYTGFTALGDNVVRDCHEVVKNLKEEVEELKEENRAQKEQLSQKDEDKREVIRQLSLAMEMLRFENIEARKLKKKQQKDVAEECYSEKRSHHRVSFELEKLKDSIFTKLFQGSPISKDRGTALWNPTKLG